MRRLGFSCCLVTNRFKIILPFRLHRAENHKAIGFFTLIREHFHSIFLRHGAPLYLPLHMPCWDMHRQSHFTLECKTVGDPTCHVSRTAGCHWHPPGGHTRKAGITGTELGANHFHILRRVSDPNAVRLLDSFGLAQNCGACSIIKFGQSYASSCSVFPFCLTT